MRYDKTLLFRREGEKTYEPETGNYRLAQPQDETRLAAVVATDAKVQKLLYGDLKQGSISIHLLRPYEKPFDYLIYQGRRYHVDRKVDLRNKQLLVASEVL